MVVGYHHFRKPPYVNFLENNFIFHPLVGRRPGVGEASSMSFWPVEMSGPHLRKNELSFWLEAQDNWKG